MVVIFAISTVNDAFKDGPAKYARLLIWIVLYICAFYCCAMYFYRESICDIVKNLKNGDNDHNGDNGHYDDIKLIIVGT